MNTPALLAATALALTPMAGIAGSMPPDDQGASYPQGSSYQDPNEADPRYRDADRDGSRYDARQNDTRYSDDRYDEQQYERDERIERTWTRTTSPEDDVDEVIIRSAPNEVDYEAYGSPPTFRQLDRNGDGVIDEHEAQAYPPLANDFLYASGNRPTVPVGRYTWWTDQLR